MAAPLNPYKGGEELRRAAAALAGPTTDLGDEADRGDDVQQSGLPAVHVPPVQVREGADPATRELAFAAQRYARAAARAPADYEAVYNHGLALQELAARGAGGGGREDQLRLLRQACERYEAAWRLRESSHAALYNWGVALSDMARVAKAADQPAAYQCLLAAADKYALSLMWNPNNPQALNNWGLVLQELSTQRPAAEREFLVGHAVAKFRRAIRLRPEFDRAVYNLGTVFYAHAFTLQAEAQARAAAAAQAAEPMDVDVRQRADEAAVKGMFARAAQYIMLSYALQPSREVYQKSLQVVQQLLPLPHLKAGSLLAPAAGTAGTCGEAWAPAHFVVDHASFRTAAPQPQPAGQPAGVGEAGVQSAELRIALDDIAAAKRCLDPSLPPGHAFWLSLHSQPQGLYFVAEEAEDAESWVDALHLAAHCAARQRLGALEAGLTQPPPAPHQPRKKGKGA